MGISQSTKVATNWINTKTQTLPQESVDPTESDEPQIKLSTKNHPQPRNSWFSLIPSTCTVLT